MALGAVDGQLVFGAQEWWRVFTAPLLHGSLMHLMGNSIALFFAGACLESLIGAAWFAALFAVAALGGVAGSLAINGASTVSVGASGAIMGLLTAAVLCSSRIAETKRRFRMQLVAGRILVPSLLPAFFPAAAMAGHIDYGAHLGGAIAGVAIAVFLKSIWDEQTNRPALQQTATVILATGAAVTILAFSIATAHRGVHVSEPVTLIPEREVPKTNAEGISRSADLVSRFPDDPRARFYRAIYFMKERDLSDAGTQLRAAVEAFSSHADDFEPQFGQTLKLTLALILAQQGDTSEARGMAQDSCTSTAPEVTSVLQSLREHGICG